MSVVMTTWASAALLFPLGNWLGSNCFDLLIADNALSQMPHDLLFCGSSEVLASVPQSTHLVSPYQRNWRSPWACTWWHPGLVDSSETKWKSRTKWDPGPLLRPINCPWISFIFFPLLWVVHPHCQHTHIVSLRRAHPAWCPQLGIVLGTE